MRCNSPSPFPDSNAQCHKEFGHEESGDFLHTGGDMESWHDNLGTKINGRNKIFNDRRQAKSATQGEPGLTSL